MGTGSDVVGVNRIQEKSLIQGLCQIERAEEQTEDVIQRQTNRVKNLTASKAENFE